MRSQLSSDDRFLAKVGEALQDGCRPWTASTFSDGHGAFAVDGKSIRAQVFAWERVHGPVPDGMTPRQTCELHACVAVEHLELVPARSTQTGGAKPAKVRVREVSSVPRYVRLARLLRDAGELPVRVVGRTPVIPEAVFAGWWERVSATLAEYDLEMPDPTLTDVVARHASVVVSSDDPADKREVRLVLACDGCLASFRVERVGELIRHCIGEHGRRPTAAEKTPIREEDFAA